MTIPFGIMPMTDSTICEINSTIRTYWFIELYSPLRQHDLSGVLVELELKMSVSFIFCSEYFKFEIAFTLNVAYLVSMRVWLPSMYIKCSVRNTMVFLLISLISCPIMFLVILARCLFNIWSVFIASRLVLESNFDWRSFY